MGEYPVKRGHKTDLKQVMDECFGDVKEEDRVLISSFGALKKIRAWTDTKKFFVETEMKKTDDETIMKTVKAYNKFLELSTGYTIKERMKKAKSGSQ
ncbi:MAG: DUF5611 family protein [Thermoplasmatales archaeon]|nr:DUF5611 family protein [Thermoplasmatales archaeon]